MHAWLVTWQAGLPRAGTHPTLRSQRRSAARPKMHLGEHGCLLPPLCGPATVAWMRTPAGRASPARCCMPLTPLLPAVTDVALCGGRFAVSVSYRNATTSAVLPGRAFFFEDGEAPALLGSVALGYLPDAFAWDPSCATLLAANEGEPNSYGQAASLNPEGSVSVVKVRGRPRRGAIQGAKGVEGVRCLLPCGAPSFLVSLNAINAISSLDAVLSLPRSPSMRMPCQAPAARARVRQRSDCGLCPVQWPGGSAAREGGPNLRPWLERCAGWWFVIAGEFIVFLNV